jgi:hypothetical protein
VQGCRREPQSQVAAVKYPYRWLDQIPSRSLIIHYRDLKSPAEPLKPAIDDTLCPHSKLSGSDLQYKSVVFRGTVRTDWVGLWVSPLRRGSSEGLPAALTRPRRSYCTTHFWMYPSGVRAVPNCQHVEALGYRRWVQCGGSVSIGGACPCSSPPDYWTMWVMLLTVARPTQPTECLPMTGLYVRRSVNRPRPQPIQSAVF